jgi:hypothetical protein
LKLLFGTLTNTRLKSSPHWRSTWFYTRPRRFTPPRALRACFIPQPRPGFTLQGFLSAIQPTRLIDVPCPLVVGRRHLPQPKPRRQLLQLAFRALIQTATRSRSANGLDLPNFYPLLCFHSLGLFSARLATAFTAAPLTTFAASAHCPPVRWSPAFHRRPTW